MKINDRYLGSNIAIALGLLSIIGITENLLISMGAYGSWGQGMHFVGGHPGFMYGLIVIVGAITYKAAKKRKFYSSKAWLCLEVVGVALFLYQFVPNKIGGYVAPGYEYVERINWPFLNTWSLATQSVLEYRVPAIITLIVWMWTIAAYFYIKSRKSTLN